MTNFKLMRHHIDALMREQNVIINEEIHKISTSFQEKIDVSKLSDHMKAIIKILKGIAT